VSEDEWGDLEGLYKACKAAIADGSLFTQTLAYMYVKMNDRVKMTVR